LTINHWARIENAAKFVASKPCVHADRSGVQVEASNAAHTCVQQRGKSYSWGGRICVFWPAATHHCPPRRTST
jgi:hypothetical protein